jgi:hypothetical protein
MSLKELQELVTEVGPDVRPLDIEFAGIKKTVLVKHLSFEDANAIGSQFRGADGQIDKTKVKEYRIHVLHRSLVDADGKPDCDPLWLAGLRNALFDSLETQVLRGLGLMPEVAEAAKGN